MYGWHRHLYAPYEGLRSIFGVLPPSIGKFNVPWRGIIVFIVGAALIFVVNAMRNPVGLRVYGTNTTLLEIQLGQAWTTFVAGLGGAVLGFVSILVVYLINRFRDVALALLALFVLYVSLIPYTGAAASYFTTPVGFIVGAVVAWIVLFGISKLRKPTTFGSAEWADAEHIENAGMFAGDGFWLGAFPVPGKTRRDPPEHKLLRYNGDRHLLTIAPTRSGKGVSAIIPNLLTYKGSAIVIDPKGENALITMLTRHKLGNAIYLVDPWGIVVNRFNGAVSSRFNPMDWLRANDPDIGENAMMLADALVVANPKSKEPFWDEEAKALLMGLILYVALAPDEKDKRTLARVRDLLLQDADEMQLLFQKMYRSNHPIVAGTGARCMQKEERALSNVLSSAQSHTHFLDSPRLRESLSRSDFRFEDLKSTPGTVYLVLPSDRLNTFNRWLRLLIQHALTVNARNIDVEPERPILFLLDEMPALGRLTMIEQAYGLMAGFGVQIWGIAQDASQLRRLYEDGWETFISNAGCISYYGSRDVMTAEYFSKLAGVTTINSFSRSIAHAVSSALGSGTSTTSSTSVAEGQRNLAYPDELMRLADNKQLLLIQNMNPISALRIKWHEHDALKGLGFNLRAKRTAAARRPAA
jgi:type IV secretion system protein VirD4